MISQGGVSSSNSGDDTKMKMMKEDVNEDDKDVVVVEGIMGVEYLRICVSHIDFSIQSSSSSSHHHHSSSSYSSSEGSSRKVIQIDSKVFKRLLNEMIFEDNMLGILRMEVKYDPMTSYMKFGGHVEDIERDDDDDDDDGDGDGKVGIRECDLIYVKYDQISHHFTTNNKEKEDENEGEKNENEEEDEEREREEEEEEEKKKEMGGEENHDDANGNKTSSPPHFLSQLSSFPLHPTTHHLLVTPPPSYLTQICNLHLIKSHILLFYAHPKKQKQSKKRNHNKRKRGRRGGEEIKNEIDENDENDDDQNDGMSKMMRRRRGDNEDEDFDISMIQEEEEEEYDNIMTSTSKRRRMERYKLIYSDRLRFPEVMNNNVVENVMRERSREDISYKLNSSSSLFIIIIPSTSSSSFP